MNDKRIMTVLFGLLVLIAASCSQSNPELEAMAQKTDVVYKHYKTSDYAAAKTAVLGLIGDLEKGTQDSSQSENHETYRVDILLSYVRLAKLEEKNGGTEKELYMKKAVEQCENLKRKLANCSPDELRKMVDKVDEKNELKLIL